MPWTYNAFEPKVRPDLLSDEVPWRGFVGPGVIVQKKDGAFQRSYLVRGPDLVNESDEVQGAVMLQANEVFKRLGGGWTFQSEMQRTRVHALPSVTWLHPIPHLIDLARRYDLLVRRESRQSTYYMTLTWVPPKAIARRLLRFLIQGPGEPHHEATADAQLVQAHTFVEKADFLMELLRSVLAVGRPLTTAETQTYLHNCVSDDWYELKEFANLNDIDHQLCNTPLDPAGWYPELGRWHLRTMSVLGYPAESMAGLMRKIGLLGLDCRWTTRWIGMEKFVQQQMLKKTEARWVNAERSMMDRSVETLTGHHTRVIDPSATNMGMSVNAARQEIGMDLTAYGWFTSAVSVWDEDPIRVETKLAQVMQAFANEGFTVRREDEHLVAVYLGGLPGDRENNVRRTPQSGLTVAHLAPGLNTTWPGPERDAYFNAGPWFYAQTEDSDILRVVNHFDGLGHFKILGGTGSGKSTFANFLATQWMQQDYGQPQVKTFDLGRHARLRTLLLGGGWHDLGATQFQPLRHCDDPVRQPLILHWLYALLRHNGIQPDTMLLAQRYLASGVRRLAAYPIHERTFSGLLRVFATPPPGKNSAFSNGRIKIDGSGVANLDTTLSELDKVQMHVRWILQRYTKDGDCQGVFDGCEEDFETHPVQTYEMKRLTQRGDLQDPVMRYVLTFGVKQQMTTDRAMLLLFDDAAVKWLIPEGQETWNRDAAMMQKEIEELLQTARKEGVSIGFVTHSLSQVFRSALGVLLLESCPATFAMPNTAALKPDVAAIYARIGFTDNAIRTIALASRQRDVFWYVEDLGQRLFSLPFTPFELDCFARNTDEDHALIDTVLAQEGREGFAAGWLRACGWEEEAYAVEHWHARQAETARVEPVDVG
jgi:type IV secretion system protein TrbE